VKASGAAVGGVAVVVGLGVLYLAVTGQLDKLDKAVRSAWGAARGSWLGQVTVGPIQTRPVVSGGRSSMVSPPAGSFPWPLPWSS
jgi:hypothetical protein